MLLFHVVCIQERSAATTAITEIERERERLRGGGKGGLITQKGVYSSTVLSYCTLGIKEKEL